MAGILATGIKKEFIGIKDLINRMKIGIVTRPLLANYGGILQNYALQHVLKRLGHEPITIDYVPRYSVYRYIRSFCKTLMLFFVHWKRRPFVSYKAASGRNERVDAFCHKYLALTKRVGSYSSDVVEEYGMEAVITGSDQVWRQKYNRYPGHLEDLFLRFVREPNVKRMAYAASFGIDEWDYSPITTENCRELAQKFTAISVRENSGVDLCKKYLQVYAVTVLDPTLLLNKEDYEQICVDVPSGYTPFVAVYVLDISLRKRRYIDDLVRKTGMPQRYFSAHHNMTLSIEEWLAMFRDAAFVITDSFHGTVFSIIFNKPFLTIGNTSRGMARFFSLLKMFGLQDRLFDVDKMVNIPGKIDWNLVNLKRAELQSASFDFLRLLNEK